jgi:LmbE family N-acetylglucosaminyl deacetylase
MKSTSFHNLALRVFCVLLFSGSALGQVPGSTLLVVAHPDDEYYFAATTYRIAVELHGTVDELVITNGEGGFRYSTLAEAFYEKPLTTEAVGRKELPAIRKEETLNAGKILGIRDHYFLDQKDEKFTTDESEGPRHLWNASFVTKTIADLIKSKHYQYVFTVLPRSTAHGHHQAATVLTYRAIHSLPETLRPVLLGFDTDGSDYIPLSAVPETHGWHPHYAAAFDRNAPIGFHNALSYQIVVNWMIAEHKSQGLLQTMDNKDPKEYIWIDPQSAPRDETSTATLFQLVIPHAISTASSK